MKLVVKVVLVQDDLKLPGEVFISEWRVIGGLIYAIILLST
jgi:hypothetical protein